MSKYEKIFNDILKTIRLKHPELLVKLFDVNEFNDGAQGEYVDNYIRLAINHNWEHNIGTLLHEYSHFLRECKYSEKHKNRINYIYNNYDKNDLTKKERYKLLCAVAKEEYLTDIAAIKFLKKYKLNELIKPYIEGSNRYNMSIKYSLYTQGYTFLRSRVRVSDKLMSSRRAGQPLTKEEMVKLQQWEKEGKLNKPSKLWRDKDE